jgi:hypothetical protein
VPLEPAVTCRDGPSAFIIHIVAPLDYRTPAVSIREERSLFDFVDKDRRQVTACGDRVDRFNGQLKTAIPHSLKLAHCISRCLGLLPIF